MAKSGKLERTLQRILSREGAKSQRRNTGNSDPLNLSSFFLSFLFIPATGNPDERER
jgi:hypothetical protein